MTDCFDCRNAALREWHCFAAGCRDCIDRALASVKTPAPTATPAPTPTPAAQGLESSAEPDWST